MILLDSLDLALDVLFFAMFGVALIRFLRRPDALHRDVLLVFASFAGLFLIALVLKLWPESPRSLTVVWTLLLFLQPPLTLRVAGHFRRSPRWLLPLAFAWMGVSLVLVLTTNVSGGIGLAVAVGYLVVIDLVGAREFHRAAAARVGTARARLTSSAVATALFALALLIVGIAAWGRTVGIALSGADQLARSLGVLTVLGYLAAFLPPQRLLRGVQRAIAFEWLDSITRTGGGSAHDTWAALADAARSISGARSVLVLVGDGVVARAGEPVDELPPQALGTAGRRTLRGNRLLEEHGSRPTASDGVDDAPPSRIIRLHDEAGSATRIVLLFEGTPLFVEDDVALITLLGDEAARTVVRDQALGERAALERQLSLERHRADDEARLRSLLDAQPTALMAVGPTRRILYANERAAEMFGTDHASILHASVDALLPGALDAETRGGAVAGRPMTANPMREPREATAVLPDGRSIPVEVGLSEWSGESDTMTLVTVADITGRKAAETMRERFIDLLSHELRTPVTAIYGGAQLLVSRHGRLAADTEHEIIVGMASEADRLQRMVENLIALARVERGVPMVADDPVLLQRLVPRLVAQEQAQWPGARFEHHLPAGLATVRGDDDYLGQVLRNLLSNAVKYGGEEGLVEVSAIEDARTVTLMVADRGAGFPADEAESLFGLYYRSESAPRHIQGAGIGLFVCRRIVEAMGGRIRASARPGGGSVFEVELLIYDSDEASPEPPATSSGSDLRPGMRTPAVAAV